MSAHISSLLPLIAPRIHQAKWGVYQRPASHTTAAIRSLALSIWLLPWLTRSHAYPYVHAPLDIYQHMDVISWPLFFFFPVNFNLIQQISQCQCLVLEGVTAVTPNMPGDISSKNVYDKIWNQLVYDLRTICASIAAKVNSVHKLLSPFRNDELQLPNFGCWHTETLIYSIDRVFAQSGALVAKIHPSNWLTHH